MDGWKERPGLTARLLRERVTDPAHGPDYLPQSHQYVSGRRFLRRRRAPPGATWRLTPWLHVDYCFDPGAQLNLYLHKDDNWYEFLLTGRRRISRLSTAMRCMGWPTATGIIWLWTLAMLRAR